MKKTSWNLTVLYKKNNPAMFGALYVKGKKQAHKVATTLLTLGAESVRVSRIEERRLEIIGFNWSRSMVKGLN